VLLSENQTCLRCGHTEFVLRLDNKSRMSREVHVRFRESLGVQFPRATRLQKWSARAIQINATVFASSTFIVHVLSRVFFKMSTSDIDATTNTNLAAARTIGSRLPAVQSRKGVANHRSEPEQ
jgi:hypothetical protein